MNSLIQLNLSDKKLLILHELQIDSVVDLLTHYPFRYDVIKQTTMDSWEVEEKVCFEGELISSMQTKFFGKYQSFTKFQVKYEEEVLEVGIFNRYYLKKPTENSLITVIGKYEGYHKVTATVVNFKPLSEQIGIHPIYATKTGLTQKELNSFIKKALALFQGKIVDVIPHRYLQRYQMINKAQAMQEIHFPSSMDQVKQALRHLKYEEFLKFHITMQSLKQSQTKYIKGKKKQFDELVLASKIAELPYQLTQEQTKALSEILSDLRSDVLMYRLLQGDVGCGKTIVAALAMYATVLSGKQACMMAPTEILAKQHVLTLRDLFPQLRIGLLCASLKSSEKREVLTKIASGEYDMVIGTHALFQEGVLYANLGLVIADEQHRFGVDQRRKLKEKGQLVDFLLMSATPIPRTLALSLYGDMSVSTIQELPKGRQPVITKIVHENTMASILPQVIDLLDHKQQCYVICPMIAESEVMDLKHAQGIYHSMNKVLGRKYQIGLLHGKMVQEEKEAVMAQFSSGQLHILVSTTVVEVGVNVPRANCMVIYDANRFGLSQLHQLRGRVGRGLSQGYCFLLCASKNKEALERLAVLEKERDGFEIAKEDLRLRGPGEILGKRQSGVNGFVLGDIMIDHTMLEIAREDAIEILKEFELEEYHSLRTWLKLKEKENISYMD